MPLSLLMLRIIVYTKKSNYLTLDKGSADGIERGMGVITSNGVVGIVLNTSAHFSSVQSLLHPDTKISVTLDTSKVFGSLVWGGNIDPRFAMVRDIPNHIKVKKRRKSVYLWLFSFSCRNSSGTYRRDGYHLRRELPRLKD